MNENESNIVNCEKYVANYDIFNKIRYLKIINPVASLLPIIKRDASIPLPRRGILKIRGDEVMMRILKQMLFIAIFSACASLSVMAQDQGGKRVPPKDDKGRPPVVVIKEKDDKNKPREEKPRDDDRRNDNRGRRPEE